ncbi:iron ABC transporter permease [Vibrio sp. AK197]
MEKRLTLTQPMPLKRHKYRLGLVIGALLLVGFSALSIAVGARNVAFSTTLDALFHFDQTNTEHLLVHWVRLPRTILAIFVGAGLGAAGALMQALTRNPLADPGILGVNAGAMVGIVGAIALFGFTRVEQYLWFGMAGASLAGLLVYVLSSVYHALSPVRLILAGAAVSVVLLAITQIITINSDQAVFDQFRHWAVGSLQGRGFSVVWLTCGLITLGSVIALNLSRLLDILALGDDLGRALGVNPRWVWLLVCGCVVVLASSASAAAGPISFVGLTAPHIARFLVGPGHRWLIPYSMMISALLLLAADVLGRVIGSPGEISVGIMVTLLGGPVFIVLVRRWRLAQL